MIVLPLIVTVDAAVTSTVTSRNSAAFTSHHFRRIRITPPKTSSLLEQYRGGGSSSAAMDGLKNSLASALAAACSKTLLAPLDTIKTVQQYHRSTLTGGYSKSLSFLQAINLIVSRPKGFREFYVSFLHPTCAHSHKTFECYPTQSFCLFPYNVL